MDNMTDLSFTQTSRAMSSMLLDRATITHKPIWQIAAENNAKEKRLILRNNGVKISDSSDWQVRVSKPYYWMTEK